MTTSQNSDSTEKYNPSYPVTWDELIHIHVHGLSLDKYDEIRLRKTVVDAPHQEKATRHETIYELLKHFRFSCPGGEVTPICDLCGANQYCIEIRGRS